MNVVYDSERVTIPRRAGDTGKAMLSFAGIGLGSDGMPQVEFARTLSGTQNDQFFVVDKLRSWYNAPDGEISEQLAQALAPFDEVHALGNSMGGFGAIYFGRKLSNCQSVIAFGLQYSVHPDLVPAERRWQGWRRAIEERTVPHALVQRRSSSNVTRFLRQG
jgi:hypothetical protein